MKYLFFVNSEPKLLQNRVRTGTEPRDFEQLVSNYSLNCFIQSLSYNTDANTIVSNLPVWRSVAFRRRNRCFGCEWTYGERFATAFPVTRSDLKRLADKQSLNCWVSGSPPGLPALLRPIPRTPNRRRRVHPRVCSHLCNVRNFTGYPGYFNSLICLLELKI